jgi:hypothetical protein
MIAAGGHYFDREFQQRSLSVAAPIARQQAVVDLPLPLGRGSDLSHAGGEGCCMMASMLLLAALTAALSAQTVQTGVLHNRQAYVLENSRMRVSALRGGGHIAEVRFVSRDPKLAVNPMRVPHYPTIEPYQYDPAKHDAIYGESAHRWLSSGYMGHLLCFPSFGPPSSDEEVRNQLGNHGEAPIVEWVEKGVDRTADAVTLRYGADLPRTQYRVERAITLRGNESAVFVEEWVENLANYDRPINWVQHATFGPPFVEPGKTFLDVSATRGEVAAGGATGSLQSGSAITWPNGISSNGKQVSLRPMQPNPHSGTYYALRMDPARPLGYFTMYHAGFGVLIGYLYPTSDNPWIGDWQENQRNTGKPWDGKAIARGMEFGTTPFAEGLRKSVERGSMFSTPTYRWINGKQRLKTTFTIFLAEIPEGFQGVADVKREPGRITIRERESGKTITVATSLPR